MTKLYFFNGIKILLFCILLLLGIEVLSQSRTVRKSIKDKEKVERQEERKYEISSKKAIEDHYKRQSDRTKEQMKQSKKSARRYRKKSESGFIERFINRRRSKKEQRKRSKRQKR